MTERDLNAIVDAAARAWTDVDPPAGLTRRIEARLAPRPTRAWLRPPAVVAVAAAASVLVAIGAILMRPDATVVSPVVPIVPSPPAIAAAAPDRIIDPAPVVVSARTSPSRVDGARPPAVQTDAELAWAARGLPALEAIEPVDVSPIQPAPAGIALLELTPLATTALRIAPLGASGDGGRD